MEPSEYLKLAEYEEWYWWYRAQRHALVAAVQKLALPPGARLLDAGCGSGRNLIELSRRMPIAAYGVDLSMHAAGLWNGDDSVQRGVASTNELPYARESFDAVVSVDVIYCEEVDVWASIAEMVRVLRPGGRLVLTAPAFHWLRSAHDVAVHGVRRFTRRELCGILRDAGLRVERARFLFGPFFPIIALSRLMRKSAWRRQGSDLSPLPRWLNDTLFAVAMIEQRIGRFVSSPIGTTILTVARKET